MFIATVTTKTLNLTTIATITVTLNFEGEANLVKTSTSGSLEVGSSSKPCAENQLHSLEPPPTTFFIIQGKMGIIILLFFWGSQANSCHQYDLGGILCHVPPSSAVIVLCSRAGQTLSVVDPRLGGF